MHSRNHAVVSITTILSLVFFEGISSGESLAQSGANLEPVAKSATSADDNVRVVCPVGSLGAFRHGTKCTGFYGPSGLLEIRLRGASSGIKHTTTKELVHAGIDIVAAEGSEIRPIADGRVVDLVANSDDPNFSTLGYMVLVKHSVPTDGRDTYSIYLHLRGAPEVKMHDSVVRGDTVLGHVGATGVAFIPHIHLEVRHFEGRFSPRWRNIYGKQSPSSEATFEQADFDQSWVDPLVFKQGQAHVAPEPARRPVSAVPGVLDDPEARDLVEWLLNNTDLQKHSVGILLGEAKFVERRLGGGAVAEKGEDEVSEWPLYQAFAEMRLIKISGEKDLTDGKFRGWGEWAELTQRGVRRVAKISVTEKGRAAGTIIRRGDFEILRMNIRPCKVNEIVSNNPFAIGGDSYRVIEGSHVCDLPADLAGAWMQARGSENLNIDARFGILLKYDKINKQWNTVAADIGPRDQDLAGVNVARAVEALKRTAIPDDRRLPQS